jgi:hypothetical protein
MEEEINTTPVGRSSNNQKDPDELLKIVQDLNRVLKREEQVRRDFREARRANNPSEEIQC